MKANYFKLFVLVFGVVVIAGCNPAYTCGEFPEAGCQPVSDVYDDTNQGVEDYRKDFYGNKSKSSAGNEDEYSRDIDAKRNPPSLLTDMAPGNPIIKERRVVRMLLNNWRDEENDLHSGEYIFMRVGEEEWVTR